MTLLETQRRMAAALMLPLTSSDRIPGRTASGLSMSAEAAAFIKPNRRMSSVERLEVYCRSYWFRLLDSFRDDFPGLAAILGTRAFERLARAYLVDCPSRSFTLRDLGSRLDVWLGQHPEFGGSNPAMARDMARIEWAHIVAFDGPGEEVLGPDDLAELKPGLCVGLQRYINLLELDYAVDEFRVKTNSIAEDMAATSNMPAARTKRGGTRLPGPRRDRIFVAVHRIDLSVYYRRLTTEQFRLLCSLQAGRSIAASIETAFEGSSVAPGSIPELLRIWFSTWAQFGWLTPRDKTKGGSRP